MAKPMGCPGRCVYCPTYSTAPQSYTPESPAVQRARACDYDPFKQTEFRLRILTEMGHPTDKVELIVMGGTFLAAPEDYQRQFIKDCYDALNGQTSKDLEAAKRLNETAHSRCVGLCIETRPDWCGEREVERMLEFGATRVELGVQMLDDDIYRVVKRGHIVADVIEATRLLKDRGFKVHYHWMPGLPGSTPDKDLALSKRLFDDPSLRPDGLKIYPTMVVEGTELEKWFREGRYRPYDNDVMTDLVAAIKAEVPKYVRISRVLRDIPSKYIVGGLKDSLRDVVRERMKQAGTQCVCIRCREYGHRSRTGFEIGEPKLTRLDYSASGGKEVFLSFEDSRETLFGLLRLRIQHVPLPTSVPSPSIRQDRSSFSVPSPLTGEGQGEGESLLPPVPIVRELHVYGPELALNERSGKGAQHRGLGHALLAEAERLARQEFGASHLAILSGVGAKPYYSEAGYGRMGPYMVKAL
jgi:elongator complex protein 3